MLKVLEFDLSVPTAHLFVNKMCQMIPTEDKVGNMVLAPGGHLVSYYLPQTKWNHVFFSSRQILGLTETKKGERGLLVHADEYKITGICSNFAAKRCFEIPH